MDVCSPLSGKAIQKLLSPYPLLGTVLNLTLLVTGGLDQGSSPAPVGDLSLLTLREVDMMSGGNALDYTGMYMAVDYCDL